MAGDEKLICPNCDKETVKGEKCTLCGFELEEFTVFERFQNAIDKKKKKQAEREAEERRKKAEEEATKNPPKKGSFLRRRGGKKQ